MRLKGKTKGRRKQKSNPLVTSNRTQVFLEGEGFSDFEIKIKITNPEKKMPLQTLVRISTIAQENEQGDRQSDRWKDGHDGT